MEGIIKKPIFSLKQNCLDHLKSAIFSIREKYCHSKSVILIVDEYSVRMISLYIKMMELLECGISNIEKLELKRKKFEKMHAIYLISPTESSLDNLICDFSDKKSPQYKKMHLLLTNVLTPNLLEKIAKNQEIMSRLVSVFEFNQDFFLFDSNTFHFDCPQALSILYSKKNTAEKIVMDISKKLMTVIVNMGCFYEIDIFYMKPSQSNNFNESCMNIANKLSNNIHNLIKNLNKNGDSKLISKEAGKISLFLLDRTLDALTPLVHDFCYQPMLYDLLEIKNGICEYEVEEDMKVEKEEEEKLIKGQKIKKKIIITKKTQLSEEDEVYLRYRFKHIAEVMDGIPSEFKKFVETNSTAKMQQGQIGSDIDVEKMSEIIRMMPQYQQALNKYVLHMKLVEKCYKIFESRDLKEVGELEQSLATGVDSEGHQTKSHKLLKNLLRKFDSSSVFEIDKLRLAFIAYICLDMVEKDRESLLLKFNYEIKKVIDKLIWLGVDTSSTSSSHKGRTTKKISERIRKLAKSKVSSATLDLCRYNGFFENFLPSLLETNEVNENLSKFDKLSINEKNEILNKNANLNKSANKSLRVSASEISIGEENEELGKETPKTIFFFVGGVSHSEIRAIRGLKGGGVVMIGGTSIMNAKEYVEGIVAMD